MKRYSDLVKGVAEEPEAGERYEVWRVELKEIFGGTKFEEEALELLDLIEKTPKKDLLSLARDVTGAEVLTAEGDYGNAYDKVQGIIRWVEMHFPSRFVMHKLIGARSGLAVRDKEKAKRELDTILTCIANPTSLPPSW